MIAGSI